MKVCRLKMFRYCRYFYQELQSYIKRIAGTDQARSISITTGQPTVHGLNLPSFQMREIRLLGQLMGEWPMKTAFQSSCPSRHLGFWRTTSPEFNQMPTIWSSGPVTWRISFTVDPRWGGVSTDPCDLIGSGCWV